LVQASFVASLAKRALRSKTRDPEQCVLEIRQFWGMNAVGVAFPNLVIRVCCCLRVKDVNSKLLLSAGVFV